MKLPKLNLICSKDDLRPVMNYVLIDSNNVVATNAHVMAVHKKEELFDFTFKEIEENILISANNWKMFTTNFEVIVLDKENKIIKILRKNGVTDIIQFKYESEVGKFPNYNAVVPDLSNQEPITEISFNSKLLTLLTKALSTTETNLHLSFKNDKNAIRVDLISNDYSSYGIIMPVQINK